MALLILLPVPAIGTATFYYWWPGSPLGVGTMVVANATLLVFPVTWVVLVERRALSWSKPQGGGFRVALLVGVAMSGAMYGAYRLASALDWIDPSNIAGRAAQTGLGDPMIFVVAGFYWVFVNALIEEFGWRWFVYTQWRRLAGPKTAVLAAALSFTVHHVIALMAQFSWPIALLCAVGVLAAGVVWSLMYLRYRSIWPVYLSHALVDAAIFAIGWQLIFGAG